MTQTITAPAAARKAPAIILIGAALLALSAQFKVPFYPVPLSLQTLVVMTLVVFGGARYASAAVVAYLAAGAAGLPVFAAGGGLAYFAGPSGGFLLAFLPAAYIGGRLVANSKNIARIFAALIVADGIIFIGGALWLAVWFGISQGMPAGAAFDIAIAKGVLPFLFGDLCKIIAVVAAFAACDLWRHNRASKRG